MADAICEKHSARAEQTCSRCGKFLCPKCVSDPQLSLCGDCDLIRFTAVMARGGRRRAWKLLAAGLLGSLLAAWFFLRAAEFSDYQTLDGHIPRAVLGNTVFGVVAASIALVFLVIAVVSLLKSRGAPAVSDTPVSADEPKARFPSQDVVTLRARVGTEPRPFFVCLDCRALMPVYAALGGCARCGSKSSCLEVASDRDVEMVRNALG